MIERKVDTDENVLIDNSDSKENNYRMSDFLERNACNENYKNHYKIHLRDLFYRFKGKHIFPDRG